MANMPNGLSRGNFGQGLPPVVVIFKNWAAVGRDRKGLFGLYKSKISFFGKNLFKIYHRPICALAIQWATKQCSILDAVAPLLCFDNWKKIAKNTQNGPPEVVGNVISGVEVGAIPIKVHLSDITNSVLQNCGPHAWRYDQPFKSYSHILVQKVQFWLFDGSKRGDISTHRQTRKKSPPTFPNYFLICCPSESLKKIVWLVFEN